MDDQEMEKEAIRAIYSEGFIDIAANEYIVQFPVLAFEDAYVRVHVRYPPEYPAVPADICSCEAINIRPPLSNHIVQTLNSRHAEFVNEPYIAFLASLIEEATGFNDAYGEKAEDTVEAETLDTSTPTGTGTVTAGYDEHFNPGLIPGPPLTKDNFAEWWAAFCEENEDIVGDILGDPARQAADKRPTGRQIWEEMNRRGISVCDE